MAAPAEKLRAICLALPEAEERETWERPTFRVRGKIFAMQGEHDGRIALISKAPSGSQQVLVAADPARFFVPAYVGPKGWIGMYLDRRVKWQEVETVVRRSYALIAPRKLAARLG